MQIRHFHPLWSSQESLFRIFILTLVQSISLASRACFHCIYPIKALKKCFFWLVSPQVFFSRSSFDRKHMVVAYPPIHQRGFNFCSKIGENDRLPIFPSGVCVSVARTFERVRFLVTILLLFENPFCDVVSSPEMKWKIGVNRWIVAFDNKWNSTSHVWTP